MSGWAYYNENDPFLAEWLRNLEAGGLIAPGIIDQRSIEDVQPDDLQEFIQCHFFAGIGGWSAALRMAGWGDARPVWTGSCPCQPFSIIGRKQGADDERHLYPQWSRLIKERSPAVLFGEQVASADGLAWLDAVQADLEAAGYAVGAADLCAAGVGAPHIRQRLWFVGIYAGEPSAAGFEPVSFAADCDPDGDGWCYVRDIDPGECDCIGPTEDGVEYLELDGRLFGRRVGDASGEGLEGYAGDGDGEARWQEPAGPVGAGGRASAMAGVGAQPGPVNGFWRNSDWLPCRDGKWRPVEPGPQQMADGSADCVGSLRPDQIISIEGALDGWRKTTNCDPNQALQDLWRELAAEAIWDAPRGPWGLFEAPILLAFLRQLTRQGWRFAHALQRQSEAPFGGSVRGLRLADQPARPPLQRKLAGQYSEQYSNALRRLSQMVAQQAATQWGATCRAYAARGAPMRAPAPRRKELISAYGNAIVPQVGAAFIEAAMEVLP